MEYFGDVMNGMISFSNSSLLPLNGVPIFCFPEIIEKLPISLTYCFIYLIASTAAVALGFYLYYKRMLHDKLKKFNNGHIDNKLDIEKHLPDKKILRGMFRNGQDSLEHTEMSVLNGNK